METKVLESIGLTRNESKVYLALLKEGTSKTGKIYEILESLKKKGLASESKINNTKQYTAAAPSQILDYLDMRRKDLEEDESVIRKEIPALEKIRERKTRSLMNFGDNGKQEE